jgi:hypothetical protein
MATAPLFDSTHPGHIGLIVDGYLRVNPTENS